MVSRPVQHHGSYHSLRTLPLEYGSVCLRKRPLVPHRIQDQPESMQVMIQSVSYIIKQNSSLSKNSFTMECRVYTSDKLVICSKAASRVAHEYKVESKTHQYSRFRQIPVKFGKELRSKISNRLKLVLIPPNRAHKSDQKSPLQIVIGRWAKAQPTRLQLAESQFPYLHFSTVTINPGKNPRTHVQLTCNSYIYIYIYVIAICSFEYKIVVELLGRSVNRNHTSHLYYIF